MEHQSLGTSRPDPRNGATYSVTIAATFTAEPLQRPLQFWMDTLGIPADVTIAPYAQIMQQLLNPVSELARNHRGFNVLLIRLQDWIRDRPADDVDGNLAHVERVARELASAMTVLREQNSSPALILLCPDSSALPATYRTHFKGVRAELRSQLCSLRDVHCWQHEELFRLYPVAAYEDVRAERIGHIPYSDEYFASIATLLARRIAASSKPQCKVIALDCDNTMWRGICGEDGADGVELTDAHLALQRLLVRQYDAGVLLCLCSKNNPDDVEAVFRARPDMPLREEHLVASKINWNSKSANLQSLSNELSLSLDSFVLIDDSPVECAEVSANCPAVLTLQFPVDSAGIEHFLNHVWAFDRTEATADARQRTLRYRENRARTKAQESATDLAGFLSSLELCIKISPMRPDHIRRVSELTQRTNQFNLTSIRRTVSDIEALSKTGDLQCLVIEVSDRFGDYGLVGAVIYERALQSLAVDTFLLSCRVLGRGVEHRMVNELGRIAQTLGCDDVVLSYRQTSRSAPAGEFLDAFFAEFALSQVTDVQPESPPRFKIPVGAALAVAVFDAPRVAEIQAEASAERPSVAAAPTGLWVESAYRLSRIDALMAALREAIPERPDAAEAYVAPRTPNEQAIATVWAKVLDRQQVGICDDFFALGGDSLLAVRAIAATAAVLGRELSIHDFFSTPTIEALARRLTDAREYGLPIEHVGHGSPYPLSAAQRRLWFIHHLGLASVAYHVPFAFRLDGELNRGALAAALNAVLERHEALRMTFSSVAGEPAQTPSPRADFRLECIDLVESSPERAGAEIESHLRAEATEGFDLARGPLIRGRLLRVSANSHALLITMHHIVSDGWSIGVLIRELGELYRAFCAARPASLQVLPVQYGDYACWQEQRIGSNELREQLAYWTTHLRGAPTLLSLPTDRTRPAVETYRGDVVPVALGEQLTAQLNLLSRRHGVTIAMLLCTAWTMLLARLSGQDDIIVGIPVANRPRPELEGLIGFFVNTLAVRVDVGGDRTVAQMLERVKQTLLAAYANQDAPFERLVDRTQSTRSLSYNPVFQTMFAFQNTPQTELEMEGLTVSRLEPPVTTAHFDLSLSLQDSAGGVRGALNYASDLFEKATIERWVRYFELLLQGMIQDTTRLVSRVPIFDEAERDLLLRQFMGKKAAYSGNTIHRQFEACVARMPTASAVVSGSEVLSYERLNARANQLARYLLERGVRRDSLVGLCIGRSIDMIVALLAILKAGAAYVPLDPEYPEHRLRHIIESAAPALTITHSDLCGRLPKLSAEVIAIDAERTAIAALSPENLDCAAFGSTQRQLAYVIFTSGSTGRPKGVMIDHASVMCLWQGLEAIYHAARPSQRVAANASFNFDASVKQFVQLLSGRTLVLMPEEVRWDAAAFLSFLDTHEVEVVDCTPMQLKSWVDAGLLAKDRAGSLNLVLIGGEAIDADLWRVLAQSRGTEFYNVYGPTECTVDTTFARVNGDETKPHIGHVIENKRVYVVDKHLELVPIGVTGEIYIGGEGIARGYLDQPELTTERFLPDPFHVGEGARIYKSGDLARWRADGTLEYLGRNDHQVKVRGFRIELGEIEARLVQHHGVRQAAVVVREDEPGRKQLVAYVVPSSTAAVAATVQDLRAFMQATLPGYMIPTAFVVIDRVPLTPNGKVDRNALPAPALTAYPTRGYDAPRDGIERTLAELWQRVLGVERVGRHDDFFELGGDSFAAMKFVAKAAEQAAVSLHVQIVFQYPTLAEMARHVSTPHGMTAASDELALEEGAV